MSTHRWRVTNLGTVLGIWPHPDDEASSLCLPTFMV